MLWNLYFTVCLIVVCHANNPKTSATSLVNMGFPLKFRLGQGSNPRPTRVESPCSNRISPSSRAHIDDNKIPYAISGPVPSPSSTQASIYSRASRASYLEKSSSSTKSESYNTARRAVGSMKKLLPLMLPDELTHCLTRRSTFGQEKTQDTTNQSLTCQQSNGVTIVSSKASLPQYKNEYQELQAIVIPASIVSTLADSKPPSLELSSNQKMSSFRDSMSSFLSDDAQGSHESCQQSMLSSTMQASECYRESTLSFKCVGTPQIWTAEKARYCNSAEWHSSSLTESQTATWQREVDDLNIMGHSRINIESWINESTILNIYDSDFEENLACATTLFPSKAQVIDVNARTPTFTGLGISIPPRSSSLARTLSGCESHAKDLDLNGDDAHPINHRCLTLSGDDTSTSASYRHSIRSPCTRFDRARTCLSASPDVNDQCLSPPRTPYRITSFQTYEEALRASESLDPVPGIISGLHDAILSPYSISTFADSPCLIAMQDHLRSSKRANSLSARSALSPNSQYSPRAPTLCETTKLFISETDLRTISSSAPKSYSPNQRHCYQPLPSYRSPPSRQLQSSSSASVQESFTPAISSLEKLFPFSTYNMRFTLCAYVLAWQFITTISTPQSSHKTIHESLEPHVHQSSAFQYDPIPSKAASRLGIPDGARLAREHQRFPSRIPRHVDIRILQLEIESRILSILRIMEAYDLVENGGFKDKMGESWLLRGWIRCLTEIIGIA